MMRRELEIVIIDLVKEYCPGKTIALNHDIVHDLGILHDDVSDIVVEISRLFDMDAKMPDWEDVITVNDLVKVVEENGSITHVSWPRPRVRCNLVGWINNCFHHFRSRDR